MARRRTGRAEPEGRDEGPPADPVAVAREIALRQLTVRARTRSELERAMASRGVPPEAAEQVLERFTELHLVDDADFARSWAASAERRLRSTRVVAQELRTKGVDAETISATLAEVSPDADYRSALALGRKKAGSLRGLDRQVGYRRLAGALARRGFSSDVVRRVVAEVLDGTLGDDGAGVDVD